MDLWEARGLVTTLINWISMFRVTSCEILVCESFSGLPFSTAFGRILGRITGVLGPFPGLFFTAFEHFPERITGGIGPFRDIVFRRGPLFRAFF